MVSVTEFYAVRKQLFPNVLNSINTNTLSEDLTLIAQTISQYMSSIMPEIENEIKNIARQNAINWREKKNPKLLAKFINSDTNIAVFNREINKISMANCIQMMHNINNILNEPENIDKVYEYTKYIYKHIFQKCLHEELFSVDYIKFLIAFPAPVDTYFKNLIHQTITTINVLLQPNNNGMTDHNITQVYDGQFNHASNISPKIKL